MYMLNRTDGTTTLKVNNMGFNGLHAVVTDLAATAWTLDVIDLSGYGHVLFRDVADSITVIPVTFPSLSLLLLLFVCYELSCCLLFM